MSIDCIVVGSGVVGVATAYALHKRGLRVTVIDRAAGPADETSYANAGQLSFGYSGPWAYPGLLQKIPAMLANPDGPVRCYPDFSSLSALAYQAKWLRWFLPNTRRSRFEQNKSRILQLSAFSAQCFEELLGRYPLDFSYQKTGTLQLFRSQTQFDTVRANDLPGLQKAGVKVRELEAAACVTREPALSAIRGTIAGGLLFEEDAIGDCRAFTRQLAAALEKEGVEFRFRTNVVRIEADRRFGRGVRTDRDYFPADCIIVAAGPWTRKLVEPRGLLPPIYPVRGYSLSTRMVDAASGPMSTVLDELTKVAITRFDDQVRVGGTAEIAGFEREPSVHRHELLATTLTTLFPGCADLSQHGRVEYWSGLRPMTPDGTPVVGKTALPSLFINAGHGTLGWTQAAGSAEHLARVIVGEQTILDPADYELARYGRHAQREWYLPNEAFPRQG